MDKTAQSGTKSTKAPKDTTVTKSAICSQWLDEFRASGLEDAPTRSPFVVKTVMLEAELLMLKKAHSIDTTPNQWFSKQLGGGKKTSVVARAKAKAASSVRFMLGGTISLEPSKPSYKLCSVGKFNLFVNGSENALYPFLGWGLQSSAKTMWLPTGLSAGL